MPLEIGSAAPSFTLWSQDREQMSLDDFRGHKALLVFIPYPFSSVCGGEVCELRDNLAVLNGLDAKVAVITVDTVPTNKAWAVDNGLEYPILSDFWPHGAVSQAYETFNDKLGVADRSTFVLDENGIITDIVASDSLGTARPLAAYVAALS